MYLLNYSIKYVMGTFTSPIHVYTLHTKQITYYFEGEVV